jgi:3-oxoacyl-[acyl-carrier protein] reductase
LPSNRLTIVLPIIRCGHDTDKTFLANGFCGTASRKGGKTMSEKLLAELGVDRLPHHQKDRRVTELMDLTGKVAVVTAGGGPSLGQAIVHRLAGLGASVAVLDRDGAAAQSVAESAARRWGTPTLPLTIDITNWDQVRQGIDRIVAHFGPIDIWVNNVGGIARMDAFAQLGRDEIDFDVALNLKGAMYCVRNVLDVMLPRKSGRIINIASEGGKTRNRGISVYNSCKSGIIGFTRNLAHELTGSGVSVVCVCPGIMLTDEIIAGLGALPEENEHATSESIKRSTAARASLPEEVANMVAFLASEAGSYVEATAVSVGGGLTD